MKKAKWSWDEVHDDGGGLVPEDEGRVPLHPRHHHNRGPLQAVRGSEKLQWSYIYSYKKGDEGGTYLDIKQ